MGVLVWVDRASDSRMLRMIFSVACGVSFRSRVTGTLHAPKWDLSSGLCWCFVHGYLWVCLSLLSWLPDVVSLCVAVAWSLHWGHAVRHHAGCCDQGAIAGDRYMLTCWQVVNGVVAICMLALLLMLMAIVVMLLASRCCITMLLDISVL